MFLKKSTVTIKGKTYNNYKIVESYREDGKVKHRILTPLGSLTDEQAERLRLAISAYSNPDLVVSKKDDIVVTKHLAYLDVAVLHQIWEDWGFDNFFDNDRWVQAMVLNRCIDPVSKIQVKDWVGKTVLPVYLDVDINDTDPYDIYRELDRLSNREIDLQRFICQQLKVRISNWSEAFFYDITSTYLEGSTCVLASLGYSRDSRPDREQLVIALMITPEGYPFYWRVLPGNTQDITTLQNLIKEVKEQYGIINCMMVFDRGMVSSNNLLVMEEAEWTYVSAMDRDEITTASFFNEVLLDPPMIDNWEQLMAMCEFIPFDDNATLFFRELMIDRHRYILAFDVARFIHERHAQERKIKQVLTWIKDKNQTLAQAKKAKSLEVLQREVQTMLKRKGVKKFLAITIEAQSHTIIGKNGKERTVSSYRLSYSIDQTALEKEQRLHGITCFISNVDTQSYSAEEIIQWYRDKNKVEEAFHEIKSHLDLRPIFLTREKRVKAHVSICVLAYFLYNDMEQRLRQSDSTISVEMVLNILKACLVNQLTFKATGQTALSITELSQPQIQILQALDCGVVVDKKQVKQTLRKVENWL